MFKPSRPNAFILSMVVAALWVTSSAYAHTVLYVDADAPGGDNGLSWPNAFLDLQRALDYAAAHPDVSHVRVASGTYKPDRGTHDRAATFQLLSGVAVMGGYAGYGAFNPDARDIALYETVLSGDLNGNDVPPSGGISDNSWHVVTGSNTDASAVLDGFTIIAGNADEWTWPALGGGMYNAYGGPTVVNCKFLGNRSYSGGGGMFNDHSSPLVVNCTFSHNQGGTSAGTTGGGVYNYTFSHGQLVNCILWGNTSGDSSTLNDQIYYRNGTPLVSYSCIQGWTSTWGGTGNFGSNPMFVDENGADNIYGTLDDDLRLAPGSPCSNTGDTATLLSLPYYDYEGTTRIRHCRVDVGVYESAFFQNDCNLNLVSDFCDVVGGTSHDCNGNNVPDECESPADCNSNGTQDICDVAAGSQQDCNRNDVPDACDIAAGTSTDGDANDIPDECVRFVDTDATGANNGSRWADAYTSLQAALSYAAAHSVVAEIRVAAGTYKPATSDRTASFHPLNGLAIMGGYAGYGQPDPDARDFQLYETILSGDLAGNDNGPNGREENSYHVLSNMSGTTPAYLDASAVLDGFIISGGNATSSPGYWGPTWGGGMHLEYGSPTVRNCTFWNNTAEWDGGALCSFRGDPTLINCTFIENHAGHDGGGICNRDGNLTLTDCLFVANTADNDGGGLFTDAYWDETGSTLVRCTFLENAADPANGFGGGMWSGDATTLVNCIFGRNSAYAGGGMHNTWSNASLVNCTFAGNAGVDFTGGFLTDGFTSVASLTNCIFWDNSDSGGITDEPAQVAALSGQLAANYCAIQGLTGALGGTGNLNFDPLFVDATDDDYHLQPGSPCINAGDNAVVGLPAEDYEGDPRVQQCRVDLGADETAFFGDCNANGTSDACDIAAGTSLDCDSNGMPDECGTDCNANSIPDDCDLAAGTSADCNVNETPDECDIYAGVSPDENHNTVPDECEAAILYVKKDATGANHGTNWVDACTDLQRALAVAAGPGHAVQEVWVAAGTYHPTADGDRTVSFALVNGVALYGGFAGGETDLSERDPAVHMTVLSGDLQENDAGTEGLSDNSHHVVTADIVDATAVLDGFVLTAGNADLEPHTAGGGMFVQGAHPTLANCTFRANRAVVGGGLYIEDDSPTVMSCTFGGNWAELRGGALYNECGNPVAVNTVFSGNSAEVRGGAIYNSNVSRPTFTNCTIAGNIAEETGGIYGGYGSSATVINCVLWSNSDLGGSDESAQIGGVPPAVNYSCLQGLIPGPGGLGGTGNIGADPRFRDADGPDGVPGTADDDLQLAAGSPCIDAADNEADIDANASGVQPLPATDLAGNPRFVDDPTTADTGHGTPPIVDMGAYEQKDCNANGVSDNSDIIVGTSHDYNTNGIPDECEPDCNFNGLPDAWDIHAGTSQDLNSNGIPDECEPDCNHNSTPDAYEIATGSAVDCNTNGLPDACELPTAHNCCETTHGPGCSDPVIETCVCVVDPYCCATAWDRLCAGEVESEGCGSCAFVEDCNTNTVPDECDLGAGTSPDANSNGTPDECDLANPISACPPDQATLWRTQKNCIRLTFDDNITGPTAAGQVLIRELRPPPELFGPDLSAGFTFTVENDGGGNPRILRIKDNAANLSHRKWYGITNAGDWTAAASFEVHYVVLMGDVNNDGFVKNADASAIYPHVSSQRVPDCCAWEYDPTDPTDRGRFDLNGDCYVKNADASAVYPRVSSLGKPTKPSGH
ncbi:MAG: right-handed parallel beta-helix repeat-containing protein [Planctomycetota bacterium]